MVLEDSLLIYRKDQEFAAVCLLVKCGARLAMDTWLGCVPLRGVKTETSLA